jgi:hypothetical protein
MLRRKRETAAIDLYRSDHRGFQSHVFSQLRLGFLPKPDSLGFVVDEVTPGTCFSQNTSVCLCQYSYANDPYSLSSETSSAVYQTTPNLLGSETYSVVGLLLVVSFSVGSRRCFVCTMARMVHL